MFFSVFIVSFFTWLLLTNSFSPSEVVVGLAVSTIIASVFTRYYSVKFSWNLPIKFLIFIFVYLPIFIWEMVKANFDVAARVLNPSLPLNPGFVKVKTNLKGNNSKLALANSITLTPGTLTLDVNDNNLYIHWIDVKGVSDDQKQKYITLKFEKVLKKIFE